MTANGIALGFTRAELEKYGTALLERRGLRVNDLRAFEEADSQEVSELSTLATHMADLGSDRAASDLRLGSRESASGEIRDIDEALDRIRDGSFGLCEGCDQRITAQRLAAIPYTRLCLACKKLEER